MGQTPVFIRFFVMRTVMDEKTLTRRNRDLGSLMTTIEGEAFPLVIASFSFGRALCPWAH
jgi:hypothetical protein